LTVTNSTISGNSANAGGGIYSDFGTLTVTTSTISGNSANYGGGVYNTDTGTLSVSNSIVTLNHAPSDPNVRGYMTRDSAFNLIDVGPGFTRDPGPGDDGFWGTEDDILGDYRLRSDSLAIDAGSMALLPPDTFNLDGDGDLIESIPFDLDGKSRVLGASVDIGAFEFGADVLGRYVFYNNSSFDDNAIAGDKRALLPGQTANFTNYTSYEKGINGLMIDIAAPASMPIAVRQGAGVNGSDRITIIWPDNAIEKRWLQVTIKVTDNTGLLEDDIFYFGNAPGEAGDSTINTVVNATDEIVARNFQHSAAAPALIDDPYDYNRDGLVNGTDQIIARGSQTNPLTMLRLITAPAADAAIEQVAEQGAAGLDVLSTALNWPDEFEQMTQKHSAVTNSKTAEEATDQLLATYW